MKVKTRVKARRDNKENFFISYFPACLRKIYSNKFAIFQWTRDDSRNDEYRRSAKSGRVFIYQLRDHGDRI